MTTMRKILTLDEMLEALHDLKHPQADLFQRLIENVANEIMIAVADAAGLLVLGVAKFQGVDLAGTCASFECDAEVWPFPINKFDQDADR